MKRFENILFFADGDTEVGVALRRAMALADSNRARLTVVDVIEPVDSPKKVSTHLGRDLSDLLRERRLETLVGLVKPFEQPDALICTEVFSGVPGFFIGNTAEEVLQTTMASVLAVKPAGFVSPVQ